MPIIQGSLGNVSLPDTAYDLVLMMEYLEHELDPRGVLTEARRITRRAAIRARAAAHRDLAGPHVRALLVEPRHPAPSDVFYAGDLAKMLAECGYELVRVEPFTLPLYAGMSVVQALGLRHWRKHKTLYPLLSALLALPLLPFQPLMPEFMFAMARAR